MLGLLAQLSAHERVTAVHRTFAEKSTNDLYPLLFWTFVLLTIVLTFLAITHRVQNRLARRREERRHQTVHRHGERPGAAPKFGTPRASVTGLPPMPPKQHPAVRM